MMHWPAPCPPRPAKVWLLLPASKALREPELTIPAATDHLWGRLPKNLATEAFLPESLANHQMQKLYLFLCPMHLCPTGRLRLCLSGSCLPWLLCLYPAVGLYLPPPLDVQAGVS